MSKILQIPTIVKIVIFFMEELRVFLFNEYHAICVCWKLSASNFEQRRGMLCGYRASKRVCLRLARQIGAKLSRAHKGVGCFVKGVQAIIMAAGECAHR